MSSGEQAKIDQKEAEFIARQFIMLINSAILYGCNHPTAIKNAGTFHESLSKGLSKQHLISFIINQGTFLVEDWALDKTANAGKLIMHFDKIGINSVSFNFGVSLSAIEKLLQTAGDISNIASAKQKVASFTNDTIPGVRINYVKYGKITADQLAEVTNNTNQSNAASALSNSLSTGGLSSDAIKQIEQVLSLSALLEKPREAASILSETSNPDQVRNTFGKLRAEVSSAQPHTVEELLEGICALRNDLAEAIEVQKVTGRMLKSTSLLYNQMNELTCDAIVKLVKEEYSAGKLSLKRLTQVIRRMLPDFSELMQVLPRLKQMLLSEGMSLSDYLQLIRMLDTEVESEALSGSLQEAAGVIGASVNDLVEAIKSKPEEAAQLILLASEIRQGNEQDTSRLSEILTNYIEEVCTKMALQSPDTSGPQGGQALKKVLAQLESQLFSQLKQKGIEEPVLLKTKQLLTERFDNTANSASDEWISNLISSSGDRGLETISDTVRNFAGSSLNQAHTQNSLTAALKARGYDEQQIQDFFKLLTRQVKSGGKIILPSSALGSNNMLFLINREIKQHLRYKTPFSSLTASISKVVTNNQEHIPALEEHAELLPQLFNCAKALLRDIDLIGSTDISDPPSILMILAMTDGEGAKVVQCRLKKKAEEINFSLDGQEVHVKIKVSITLPNEKTIDLKSYLELSQKNHREEAD